MIDQDHDFLLGIMVGACLSSKTELPNGLDEAVDVMPLPFRNLITLLGKKTASADEVKQACWDAKVSFEDGDTIISAVARKLSEKYLRDKQQLLTKKAAYRLTDSKDRQEYLSDALYIENQLTALATGLAITTSA